MTSTYIKGAIYGFIYGDILGNATYNMTKQDIYNTYYFFGFGLNKTFRPCNITLDIKRMLYSQSDWTDITDNLLISIKSLDNNKQLNMKNLEDEYILWRINNTKYEVIPNIYNNMAQFLVLGLIDTSDYTYIIDSNQIYIHFVCLLLNRIINLDKTQTTDIDMIITEILLYIESVYLDNISIQKINILKQYINYNSYNEVYLLEDNILKSLAFSVIAIKKIINTKPDINIFMDILMESVREGGNAHINCALVGMICGAYIGYDELPDDVITDINNKKTIANVMKSFLHN